MLIRFWFSFTGLKLRWLYLITFLTAGADGSNKWAPTFDLTDLELATEDTWSATGRDSGTGCSVGVLIVCAECWVCWANADIAHNTPETVALEKIRHWASESACCVFMQVSETWYEMGNAATIDDYVVKWIKVRTKIMAEGIFSISILLL